MCTPPVVLNLERGCVSHDPIAGLWTITGRKFKGARDGDGEKIPEGEMRDDPWVVVHETARAVAVLEQLHDQSLLFHNHVHPHAAYGLAPKTRVGTARSAGTIADDFANFITWVNTYTQASGRDHERIPPDPDGRISPARFRRTLAWRGSPSPLAGLTPSSTTTRIHSGCFSVTTLRSGRTVKASNNCYRPTPP